MVATPQPMFEVRDVPVPRGRVVLQECLYFEFRHWLDLPTVFYPSAALQFGDVYLPVFLRTGRVGPPVVFSNWKEWQLAPVPVREATRAGVYVRNVGELGLHPDGCLPYAAASFTRHTLDPEKCFLYTGSSPDSGDCWVEIAEDVILVLRRAKLVGVLLRLSEARTIRGLLDARF